MHNAIKDRFNFAAGMPTQGIYSLLFLLKFVFEIQGYLIKSKSFAKQI